jgi:hypothetical protein
LTFFWCLLSPWTSPKKNVGIFFWTHLTASTPHPPTHRPISHPPTLAYSFSHLPSHLHISNDLVSFPPTYLPTHLITRWHSYTYLLTHLPLHTLPMAYISHKLEEMSTKLDADLAIHVALSIVRSNEDITFHHVNDCVILPLSYLLATQVSTYQTPPNQTYLPGNSTIDHALPPNLSIAIFK